MKSFCARTGTTGQTGGSERPQGARPSTVIASGCFAGPATGFYAYCRDNRRLLGALPPDGPEEAIWVTINPSFEAQRIDLPARAPLRDWLTVRRSPQMRGPSSFRSPRPRGARGCWYKVETRSLPYPGYAGSRGRKRQ
jgi:hypothetical protein